MFKTIRLWNRGALNVLHSRGEKPIDASKENKLSWVLIKLFLYMSAYLVPLGLLDYFEFAFVAKWITLTEVYTESIAVNLKGISESTRQVLALGHPDRMAIVKHVLSVSFLYTLMSVVVLSWGYLKRFRKIFEADTEYLNIGSVIIGLIYAVLSCGVFYLFYFKGFSIEPYSLRGGYKIHVNNHELIGYCITTYCFTMVGYVIAANAIFRLVRILGLLTK